MKADGGEGYGVCAVMKEYAPDESDNALNVTLSLPVIEV
jgi:hypothetical protein